MSKQGRLTTFKKKKSFKKFIGLEIALSVAALFLAYFIGAAIYPFAPGLYQLIGQYLPQPLTATGYQVAYFIGAGIVWLISNSALYATGLRRL